MKTLAFSDLLHNNPAASGDNRISRLTRSGIPTRVENFNQPNPFRKFLTSAKAIALVMILMFSVTMAQAQRTASVSGNWSSTSTWGGSAVPTSSDAVTINSGITVTVDVASAQCASVTFAPVAASSTLTISGSNSLTFAGALTMPRPSTGFLCTVNVNAGTLTAGSIAMSGTSTTRNDVINITTGTLNVSGNITSAGPASQILFSGAGILNVGGNFMTGTAGTFTASTGTVNCNGSAAQVIGGYTFNVLKANNASGVSLSSAATVTTLTIGDAIPSTTFNDGGFQITSTGTLNLNSGTFNLGGSSATTWPAFATRNITAGTTIGYVSTVNQTVSTTPSYPNLTFSGAGTKTTASGTLTIAGTWLDGSTTALNTSNTVVSLTGDLSGAGNITQGTGLITIGGNWFQTGTFTGTSAGVTLTGSAMSITRTTAITFPTLTVNGTYTNNNSNTTTVSTALNGSGTLTQGTGSTLNVGGTVTTVTLNASANTNTVNYTGTSQTIYPVSYSALTLSGTTPSFSASTGISGALSISSGVVVNLGNGLTHTASTLILGGTGQPVATYGGTTSGAFYVIPAYFATATGIISATGSGCTAGTWLGYTSNDWNTASNWCGNAVPSPTTDVIIGSGATVNLSGAGTCQNITIASTASLNIGSNTLTVSGNWANSGTLGANTGTVILNDAVAPTISGTNAFYNLTFGSAGSTTLNAASTIGNNLTLNGTATVTTAATLTIPGALNIGAGNAFATGATNSWTLTVTGSTTIDGTLTLANTGAKTFTGSVTIDSGGIWNETGASSVTFGGNLTNNGTTFTALAGTHTFNNATGIISGSSGISIANVATVAGVTNNGTLSVGTALTGSFINGATGTLNFAGSSIAAALTASASGNSVNYTGAAQTIYATSYYNLGFSGSGKKTVSGSIAIGTGGAFTSTAPDIEFDGDYINPNATLLNAGTGGTIEISGSAATQSIAGFTIAGSSPSAGVVTMNKTAGVATLTGNMTNNGLTINGAGSLNLGTGLTHNIGLAVTLQSGVAGSLNGGTGTTLVVSGGTTFAWNGNGSLFTANSGTVDFNNGAQTLAASTTTFNNVIFEGGGIKTLTSQTTFNDLSIATGTAANLGSSLLNLAKTLTLGGVLQSDGQTYGSTASTATNQLSTWFGTSALGILTAQSAPGATRLVVTGTGTQIAGTTQSITITAEDALGTVITSYPPTALTFTFTGASAAPNSQSATITDNTSATVNFGTGTQNITFINGVATVPMTLYAAGTAHITVSDGTITTKTADQLTVVVSPGSLASLTFNTLATPQTSGTAFTGSPTLTAKDTWGNVATNFDASGNNVTITSTPGTGTISGLGSPSGAVLNQLASFTSGVANLSGMVFTGASGPYTFTATSANSVTTTSNSITINPATYYSRATGNWSSNTTWSTTIGGSAVPVGVYPQSSDAVMLEPGFTVTVDANEGCATLGFDGTGTTTSTLSIPTGVLLNVTGAITAYSCNTATGFNTASVVTGAGTIECGSIQVGTDYATTTSATRTTTMTSSLANFNTTGNLTVSSYVGSTSSRLINASFLLSSGTVDVDGVLTTTNENAANTAVFSMAGGTGQLNLSNAAPVSLAPSGTSTITFTGTSATVNYDGTAQTVYATPYTNLTLSTSGAKTMTGVTTIGGNLSLSGSATATLPSTLAAIGGSVSLTGTSTLTTGGNLSITGTLNIGDGTTFTAGAYTLGVTGTTTVGAGTSGTLAISSATGTKTFTGAVTINGGAHFTESAAAQLAFGSDVAVTGTLTETGSALVGIAGSLTNNGTYTASTGIHTFSGSAKTIGGSATNAIPSATFSGTYNNSGTLTDATALTVNGAFTNNGTINSNTLLTVATGITLTNNNTITANTALSGLGTLLQGSAGILNIGGTSGISTINAGTASNTVNFTGASQTIPAFNYYNLTNSGTGTTVLAPAGIIGIANTFTPGATSYTTTGSTVSFNGTTAQNVPILNYNNLTINNVAGATLAGAVSLPGVLTLTAGTLTTTSSNSLTLTNTAVGAVSGGSSTSYVNGPLVRSLPGSLATGTTYYFPVGSGANYLGYRLINPVTNAATTATVQGFATGSGGTFDATLASISTNAYWSLALGTVDGGFNSMVALTEMIDTPSAFGVVASAPALGGTYTSRGGVNSSARITSTSNVGSDTYFTEGNLPPHYIVTADNYSPVAGSTINVSAQLYGSNNAPLAQAGNVVQWSQTDALASFGTPATATSTTDVNGLATVVFTTSTVAGRVTQIIGTDATSPVPSPLPSAGTSTPITTVFGPDYKLVWGTQPTGAAVGAPMPPFTVLIEDQYGNITNNNAASVSLNIQYSTGPGVLSYTPATASASTATFSTASVSAPGDYDLVASSGLLLITTESSHFTITANAVSTATTGSSISASPTSIGANSSSTITVQARDAAGNAILTGGLTVVFSTNLGTVGATTDNGDGTYSATLTSGTLAGTATVHFSINGVTPSPAANSVQVIFTPGALDHFLVEKNGGGIIPGEITTTAFLIQVTAQDINNNTVTSFTGASNSVDLTSAGPLTVVPLNTGAFTNGFKGSISVTINNAGTFTITATQHGGSIATASNSFVVAASGPDRYSFMTGDWNNTATWAYSANASSGGAPIPVAGTGVHIVNGNTVTVTSTSAVCGTMDFVATGSIPGNNTLAISSGGILNAGAITVANAPAGYGNSINPVAGTLNAASISFPYTSGIGSQSMTISTGTVSVTGGVTTTATGSTGSTASVIFTGAGTLNVGGNFFNTGSAPFLGFGGGNDGIITTFPGSTINYNGAGVQSVKGGIVYSNLTLSNSGIKDFYNWVTGSAHGVTVTGVLSLSGTATVDITSNGTTLGTPTPADLYYSAPVGALQYNTTTARSGSTTEWPTPFVGPGGVVIANTGTITMPGASVFNPGVPLTINSGATLNTAGLLLTLGGDFVNNGTLTTNNSPITLNGTVNQSISSFNTGGTVTLTKTSGTVTLQGPLSTGPFVLNGNGGILNDNNQAVTGTTLTLSANAALTMGGSVHQLHFTDSHLTSWTAGTTLTITGWQGNYSGGSGTAGQLYVGNSASGLTTSQLAQIKFIDSGSISYGAIILSTGEVVPAFNLAASFITTPTFCISPATSATGTVNYSSNNAFASATYVAYLSDASGSFASPVNVGSVSVNAPATLSGSITITIPAGATPSGTGYLIRIDCTSPSTVQGTSVTAPFTIVNGVSNVTTPTTSTPTSSTTILTWTNPTNCFQGVMIVASTSSATIPAPASGTNSSAYTASLNWNSPGTAFGGGFVVYKGTNGTSGQTVFNLTGGVTYYYTLFTWNGTDWSSGIQVNATPPANIANFVAGDYFKTVSSGSWTDPTIWNESVSPSGPWSSFNGAGNFPTSTSAGIFVYHTVSVGATLAIDQTVIEPTGEVDLTAGTLTINNSSTPSTPDLNVLGTLDNTDATAINTPGPVTIGATGTYIHAVDGGTIPTATWASGSLCNITGVVATIPAGMTQSFSNLTWNNPSQTVAPTTNATGALSVGGTFTFANSGTGNYLWPAANCSVANYVHTGGTDRLSASAVTHTISGAFTVSGGTVDFARGTGAPTINVGGNFGVSGGSVTETGTGIVALNVTGALNISGGTFTEGTSTSATNVTGDVTVSAGTLDGGTGSATLTANGNLTVSGTGIMSVASATATPTVKIHGNLAVTGTGQFNGGTGSAAETINFTANATTHTFTAIGTFAGNQNWNILSGSTVDFGTNVLLNANASSTFSLASGGGILTANTGGLALTGNTGSIQVAGARSYNGGANYTYNGAAAQVTGPGLTGTNNLTINNSAGVTLSGPVAVGASGILTLTSGILTTTPTNLLTVNNTATAAIPAGSTTAYISGPVKWTLPALSSSITYNFPVGTSTDYLPFSLVNPTTSGASSALVQAFEPGATGASAGPTLHNISTTEYWSLTTGSNWTSSSVSLGRPEGLNYLDGIGGSTSAAGAYSWLGGAPSAYGVSNSNAIGTNRYFVLAGKQQTIVTDPSAAILPLSPFCAGSTLSVTWTTDGTFYTDNVFSVELSNGDGTWPDTPVVIATSNVTSGGTVTATIPSGTPTGTHYRIRVVGSSPVITGTDNGADLTVNSLPSGTISDGSTSATGVAVCLGDGQPPVAFTGSNGTAPYKFTYRINTGGDLTISSDVGNNVATLNAPTNVAGTYTYYLTKVEDVNSAVCTTPQTQTYVVIVNPVPDVTNPGAQEFCNNATGGVTFTGSVPSTVYSWTNDTPSIGLAASGTGDISFTAVNNTSAAVVANITVTPSYTSAAKTCTGTPVSFTITVDPTPTADQVTSVTYCNSVTTSAIDLTSSTSGTTFAWTNDTPGIGLAASGTTSTIPSFTATNSGTTPVTATIGVVPTANGCAGSKMTFTITINPTGQVNAPSNLVVCQGNSSGAVTFATANSGGTTTYAWTNDNTSIGLGASGNGNITSFTAANTTTAPIVANITVTPTFTNGSVGCAGPSKIFTITVNPVGQVNTPTNQIVCAGTNTSAVSFTTNNTVGTTVYTWTNSATSIGLAASGSGDIGAFTATNSTTAPIVATIRVTPTFNYGTVGCAGTVQTFTITVNPGGQVNTPVSQVVCQGTSTTAVNFGTTNTGGTTTYAWTNNATGIGLAASGNGNIAAFTATNTTGAPIVATITVTPTFTNGLVGCTGTPQSFTITVNPAGQVNSTSNQIVCQGNPIAAMNFSSTNTGGTTAFGWTNNATGIGLAASGTGNIASFTATNSTTAPIVATITVTPTFSNLSVGCPGTPQSFTITVNPGGQVNVPANQVLCNGTSTAAVNFTTANTVGTTTYAWTNNAPGIGLAASGNGNIASFNATNTTGSPIVATITVTPTFTNGSVGCPGTPQTFTITVNPIPTITSTVPGSNCGTGTVTLNAAASAGTVSWYGAATGGTALSTGTSFTTPSLSSTTTYYVDATSTSCTTATRTPVVATINPLPAPVITGPASVCAGTTQGYSVTATTGHTYSWSVSGGTIASGSGTNSITVNWGAAGAGTVDVTESITATSCSAAATQRAVTINALPVPTITPVASTYVATNVTYSTETGMTNYVWVFSGVLGTDYTITSGGTTTSNSVTVQYLTPNTTQTVSVNYTNGSGCTATSPVSTTTTVNVLNELTISAVRVTKTYGDVLTSHTDNASADYVVYGLAPGESISSVVITYGNGASGTDPVGSYTKTIVPSNAVGNYNPANYAHITYLNGDISVVPKKVTISATPVSKTYGDVLTNGSVSSGFSAPGLANGETVSSMTINYGSGSTAGATVGTYPNAITVSNPVGSGTFNASNYTITYVPANLTVTKAPLSITALDVPKPFGAVLSSGVYLAEGNITSSGLKNGETIGIVTMGYGYGSLATDPPGNYPGQAEASNPLGNPPFMASNYSITYHNGAINVGTVTLTVTAQDKSHCFDNLPYSGGYSVTYSGWVPGDGPSVLGGALTFSGNAINASATGSYTITPGGYTSAKYVINYVSGTLTINSAPAANTGAARSICQNGQTTLGSAAVPGNTYYWTSSAGGFTSNLANPTVSPTASTTYTLTETVTATECTNTNSVLVTVNPAPAAVAGANRTICSGTGTTLGSAPVPGSTYSWSSNLGGFSSGLANPTVSPTITSTYTVTETITATGCSNSNKVVVTVNPAAAAVAGSSRAICAGSSTTLGAAAVPGSIYSWSSSPAGFTSTLANPTVSPSVNTTYTVTETTSTGCTNTNSMTVTVNPLPSAVVGNDVVICLNSSATLGSTAVPGNSYSWTSDPAGFNSYDANLSVTPLVTTTYTLVETIGATGCSNTHSVTVTVKSAPVAFAGADRPICSGTSTVLGSAAVAGNTYSWSSNPAGFTSAVANPTVSPTVTTAYTLIETNPVTGCSTSHTVNVTVNPAATAIAGTDKQLCAGSSVQLGGQPVYGSTYSWSSVPAGFTSSAANPTVSPTVTTTYTITETTAGGCTNSNSVKVTVNVQPAAIAGADRTICYGSSVNLGAPAVVGSTYSWTSNTGFTSTLANPTDNPAVTTTYTLVETNTAGGCTGTNTVTVTVVPLAVPTLTSSGTATLCQGTSLVYTTEGHKSSYIWSISSGGLVTAGGTAADSSATVTWNTVGSQSVSVTYSNGNGCPAGTPAVQTLSVNAHPADAGTITGTTVVCTPSNNLTFSVPTIANASSYVWSVPSGGVIISGQGTNSITVDFDNTTVSDVITVYGLNDCAAGKASQFPIEVTLKPGAAGAIIGESTFTEGSSGEAYFVTPIENATDYTWTFPSGATIVTGANTNSITVAFSATAQTGSITVHGSNVCGDGVASAPFEISVPSKAFKVYPVPSNGIFTAAITFPQEETFTINIYDHLGNKVMEVNDARTVGGAYLKVINLEYLANGLYFVEFTNPTFRVIKKLLITK